jgi:hypothetical protein
MPPTNLTQFAARLSERHAPNKSNAGTKREQVPAKSAPWLRVGCQNSRLSADEHTASIALSRRDVPHNLGETQAPQTPRTPRPRGLEK